MTVPLDSSGHYEGQLGPFVNGHVDSLVLPLYQPLCGAGPTTTVRLVDVNVEAGTAVFPPLDLHYPAALGRLGVGQVVCGATNQDTFLGEKLGLRLIFDSLTDSVYGRGDISHTASVGDAFGRFGQRFCGRHREIQKKVIV